MKKTYNWNIRILINVTNNQHKIELVCSVHTNIHQIKIQITKKLNISIFDTQIELYFKGDRPMKSTSTLLQNQVKNGDLLAANITRLKVLKTLNVNESKTQKQNMKQKDMKMLGLTVVCSCTNSSCANYNQDVQINYGYGKFAILQIISHTKCQICPYKSQFLRPNMLSKSIRVNHCYYKLNGTFLNNCRIPITKDSGFLKLTKEKEINKFIDQNPWNIDMMLTIKHL